MSIRQNIAITGCAGFIGSHLTDALLEKDYKIVGIDNLSMGKMENISHNFNNPNFKFHKIDVCDFTQLNECVKHCEVIIHLAAYKIPRYGKAIKTLLINCEGSHNVLSIAKETKCKVVLASTSDVYGKNPDIPFHEESDLVIGPSTIPRWSYAVSKLFDEHLGFAFQDAYDFPVVALRFFGSYGPRHHLSWWGGPQSVFITQILNDDEVTIHGDGEQTRSFTYVSDTIAGIIASIEKNEANGKIFNIGSDHEITILELAKLIKKLCKTPNELKIKFIPYNEISGKRYEDVRRRVPDTSLCEKLLGVRAKVDLEEGLSCTIAWHRMALEKERIAV